MTTAEIKQQLVNHLKEIYKGFTQEGINKGYYFIQHKENVNEDALDDHLWLNRGTSYIYKVHTLTAIDSDKCDFIYVVIAVQRGKDSELEIKGTFYFSEGENDDVRRVIDRALLSLEFIHPVFETR